MPRKKLILKENKGVGWVSRINIKEKAQELTQGKNMSVTFPIQAIKLTPGSQITISNLSWQDFEQILIDLGEKRNSRVAYYRGNPRNYVPFGTA